MRLGSERYGHDAPDTRLLTKSARSALVTLPLPSKSAHVQPWPPMRQLTYICMSRASRVPSPLVSPGQVQTPAPDQKPPLSVNCPPDITPASGWPMVPPSE